MTESRLRWLLVVSFGLNLFLLGVVVARVGTIVGHNRHHHEFGMRERMGLGPWGSWGGPGGGPSELLSDADREIVQKALEPTRPTDANREAAEERVEKMRKLAAADTFDAEAFKALQQQGAAARAKRQAERQQAMVDALSKLSPEGRKKLADGSGLHLLMGGGPPPMGGPRMMLRHGMMHPPGAIPMDPGAAPLAAPPPPKPN